MSNRFKCPLWLKTESLAARLFSYFAIILLLILGAQNLAERALMKALLQVPDNVQTDMRSLAVEAESLLQKGSNQALAEWEKAQSYYLFVLDEQQNALSGREMHPHFKFKLRFIRQLDTTLQDRVNQPIISMPLSDKRQLVIQFPHAKHPAHFYRYYFGVSQVVIAILILSVFSLLLARFLQKPLSQLQVASRQLAEGDFHVRVADVVGKDVNEFAELAKDFDNMAFRIEEMAEKQRRLIRDVSHELRTPLARQNLALHLVRKKIPEELHPLADKLSRESDVMNELIDEIMEYSKLEMATYVPKLVPLQLDALVSQSLLDALLLKQGSQTIISEVPKDLPLIFADPRLLLRVLDNLLSNALKYAGDSASVSVCGYLADGQVILQVEDDGAGIPSAHLASIFDPFTRLEQARDKQSGGYGLGLSIVKESMRVMKATVQADNREPSGLRVTLSFPTIKSSIF